jgi:hypothetical protein
MGSKSHSICINTRRISALYNLPEKSVRRELTKLAEEKMVRMVGWDGRELRPLDAWPNADAFVESKFGDGHVLLEFRDH